MQNWTFLPEVVKVSEEKVFLEDGILGQRQFSCSPQMKRSKLWNVVKVQEAGLNSRCDMMMIIKQNG